MNREKLAWGSSGLWLTRPESYAGYYQGQGF